MQIFSELFIFPWKNYVVKFFSNIPFFASIFSPRVDQNFSYHATVSHFIKYVMKKSESIWVLSAQIDLLKDDTRILDVQFRLFWLFEGNMLL